jgi:hypothetical protein
VELFHRSRAALTVFFVCSFPRTDKNQYVHRRDSVSLATLSDKEINQRIQLGLVTATPHDHRGVQEQQDNDDDSSNEDLEEWQDFDSDDEQEQDDKGGADDSHGSDKGARKQDNYLLSTARRSSVDLHSIADNSHDGTAKDPQLHSWQDAAAAVVVSSLPDYDDAPSKRLRNSIRASSLGFGSIEELPDDEDVATVNGEEVEEMEQESS